MLSEYTRVLNARRGSPEKKSVSARCGVSCVVWCGDGSALYIFKEAQQVGHGLALAVGQHGVVDAVSRAPCNGASQP